MNTQGAESPDGGAVGTIAAVEYVDGLDAVAVHLHRPIEHLRHGLHLQVVAVAPVPPLAIEVLREALGHKLRKVVALRLLATRPRARSARREKLL